MTFNTESLVVELATILLHEESAFVGLDVVDLDCVPCRRAQSIIIMKRRAR